MTLPDGRRLGFAEFGDPAGQPVLFVHGWGDSRLTRHPDDSIASQLGIRLIGVDRPGAGLSDFKPGRRLVDFGQDVAVLMNGLGIETFPVLGWSGGGPHAAACAYALPTRVRRLSIVCGFSPLRADAGKGELRRDLRWSLPLLRWAPWVAKVAFSRLPAQYRRNPAKAFERQFGRIMPPSDQRILSQPGVRLALQAGAVEASRSGARGLAHDLVVLFGQPWGFEPRHITVATDLWFGDADPLVPAAMGRYLAAQIPNAELRLLPGEGHLLLLGRWREVLQSVVNSD
jgi:pimeloyl-ACP methyl ester carboxylesterase